MLKLVALLFLTVTCMSAPANETDLDSLLDEIFGPSTSSNEAAVLTTKNSPRDDLDMILSDIFQSNVTTSTPVENNTECNIKGQKGICIAFYLCPEADVLKTTDGIDLAITEDTGCQSYLEVCCTRLLVDDKRV